MSTLTTQYLIFVFPSSAQNWRGKGIAMLTQSELKQLHLFENMREKALRRVVINNADWHYKNINRYGVLMWVTTLNEDTFALVSDYCKKQSSDQSNKPK